MARLITCGFEMQAPATAAKNRAEGQGYVHIGSPAIETSVIRSGAASLKCDAAGKYALWNRPGTPTSDNLVLDRTYYLRAYLRVSATPSTNATLISVQDTASATVGSIGWNTVDTLTLFDHNNAQVVPSATLSTGAWYRVELVFRNNTAGNGTLQFYLDGSLVGGTTSQSTTNLAPGLINIGRVSGGTGATVYVDDVAMNDDQGSDENGLPGNGKIVLLKPVSDGSRTGWTAGAGSTSNLWDAVDATPPAGVAVASATDTSQIKDANLNSTDAYDAVTQSYTAAGLPAGAVVKVVSGIVTASQTGATGQNVGAKLAGNPTGTKRTSTNLSVAAGTYPTGWQTSRSEPVYLPSLTLGTGATVELTRESSVDTETVCFMGAYVEWNDEIVSLSETVTVSESVASDVAAVQADTATLSESQAKDVASAQADAALLSEAQVKEADAVQADAVSLSEGAARDVSAAKADSVAVTDVVVVEDEALLSSSLVLSDFVAAEVQQAQADAVTLLESLSSESGVELSQALSDSLTLTDAITDATVAPAPPQADVGGWMVRTKPLRHAWTLKLEDRVRLTDESATEHSESFPMSRKRELILALLA